jgi:hypothetical protein
VFLAGKSVQLAAACERFVSEDADGARECGAPGALMRLQLAPVGPSRYLAMGGKFQGLDLVAGQAMCRRPAGHGADVRRPNSIPVARLQATQ